MPYAVLHQFLKGIKEGVKALYLLVVNILSQWPRDCELHRWNTQEHSTLLDGQGKAAYETTKKASKTSFEKQKMKGLFSNSWMPGSRVFQNQKALIESSRTHPSGVA